MQKGMQSIRFSGFQAICNSLKVKKMLANLESVLLAACVISIWKLYCIATSARTSQAEQCKSWLRFKIRLLTYKDRFPKSQITWKVVSTQGAYLDIAPLCIELCGVQCTCLHLPSAQQKSPKPQKEGEVNSQPEVNPDNVYANYLLHTRSNLIDSLSVFKPALTLLFVFAEIFCSLWTDMGHPI